MKHTSKEPGAGAIDSTSAGAFLKAGDVAKILRVSVWTVRELQKARAFTFYKLGGSVRFSKDDLVAYLERCRVRPIDRDLGT